MAPAKISEVVPTPEEDKEAQRIIDAQSKSEAHSLSCAMTHFYKKNPDATAQLAEGALKEKFAKRYLILQMRHKKTMKKFQTNHEISTSNAKMLDAISMNRHKLLLELGDVKANLFMGVLKAHKCS